MIKLCIFDMGGVMIRDYHIGPELVPYLGWPKDYSIYDVSPKFSEAINDHSKGIINEEEVWEIYKRATGKEIPDNNGESLLGKFFHPVLDEPTVKVVEKLKENGVRVVCGTNVIDAHYDIHNDLKQYEVFDKVYPSHLIKRRKPELDFYEFICSEEGVKPEEAFFTDDLQDNVDAAIQAGLNGYLYIDANKLKKDLEENNLL